MEEDNRDNRLDIAADRAEVPDDEEGGAESLARLPNPSSVRLGSRLMERRG